MTDYSTLIDAETLAFIERTGSFYPTDTTDLTIERQRKIYDRMCREFFAGYPEGVTAETTVIVLADRSIPIRIYRMAGPEAGAVVIYLHGGGFILGGLDSHDDVCAELCHRTGFEVVGVDYRLAPEHRHPAQFDDVLSAFEWAVIAYKRPIILVGDSAGGNLAALVAHATRGDARAPVGQVLIYPVLGGASDGRSYRDHAEAPMLTLRDVDYYRRIRTGGVSPSSMTTLYPLANADFTGLPPTVLITAQCDPLSSDGEAYRDRVLATGGKAWWHEEAGLVHGYLRARHSVRRARDSFSRIVEAVSALAKGEWPY